MGRRSDHTPEQLKTMILDACEQIVTEEGPDALTARKVAAAIGYTVGTLYNLYRNMDELVLYVNGRTIDEISARLHDALAPGLSPADLAKRLAHAYVAYSREQAGRWRLLVEHQTDLETRPEWYTSKIAEAFSIVGQVLEPLTGDRESALRAAHVLWAGVTGITMLAIREKLDHTGPFSAEALTEDLYSHYLSSWASAVPAL